MEEVVLFKIFQAYKALRLKREHFRTICVVAKIAGV
jgi:hypothetical protein